MPNWVVNDLTVSGPLEDVHRFVQQAKDRGEAMSFGKFIPYPKKYTNMDKEHPRNVLERVQNDNLKKFIEKRLWDRYQKKYSTVSDGYNSGGYEWCITHWGCKWDASETHLEMISFKKTARAYYSFQTPWSPPEGALKTMSKAYPRLKFKVEYCGITCSQEEIDPGGLVFQKGTRTLWSPHILGRGAK